MGRNAPDSKASGPSGPFWKTKRLSEMTPAEWESLCDGCGLCCLVLVADEETERVYETDLHCRLYDPARRRCTDYANRRARVPDCVRLTPENVAALAWMPKTCAYRLLAEGRDLEDWHPLVSGDPDGPLKAGIAKRPRATRSEADCDDEFEDRITVRRT